MLRIWLLQIREEIRRVLSSSLWTYPVAILIGLYFVGAIIEHYAKGEPPNIETIGITLGVTLIGVQLVAIVIYDSSQKYRAKRKLGFFLAELPIDELDRLRAIVSSATFPTLFGYVGNEQVDGRGLSGWFRLVRFLNEEPAGSRASRALFQPSLAGRLRYLDSSLALARTGRRRIQGIG